MRRLLLQGLVLWLCGVSTAAAHAPPQVRRLLFDADGSPRVLVANRGLIFRDGDALSLMCNEALLLSTDQLPAVVQLDEGSLLAATPLGLFLTADRACSWQRQALLDQTLSATSLVQAPDAPGELWLAASAVSGASCGADAGADVGCASDAGGGVYVSTTAGRSWELRWRARPGDYLQDLLLEPGSPRRVYALHASVEQDRVVYSMLQASDSGQSWHEQPLSLQDGEEPALLAVDPREPTRLIAKAVSFDHAQRERLLVSHDGAKSFASPLSLFAIGAASWSEDGARAWVAAEEGLYLSTEAARASHAWVRASCSPACRSERIACTRAGFSRGSLSTVKAWGSLRT
jgi:hypothetical protein